MWQKIKNGFMNFMSGRYGADNLSRFTLIAGLVLTLLASIIGFPILSLLGFALYVITIFRMFSRNTMKRSAENDKYMQISRKAVSEVKQFFVRLKNFRKYKYFRCPECNSRLRLPRKVGEVNVTCGKCRHQFKMKA